MLTRHCFVCDTPITSAVNGELEMRFSEPPNNAVCWHTRGNYGSGLIDSSPEEPSYEITICDDCIRQRQERITWYLERNQHKIVQTGTGLGEEIRKENHERLRKCVEGAREELEKEMESE